MTIAIIHDAWMRKSYRAMKRDVGYDIIKLKLCSHKKHLQDQHWKKKQNSRLNTWDRIKGRNQDIPK